VELLRDVVSCVSLSFIIGGLNGLEFSRFGGGGKDEGEKGEDMLADLNFSGSLRVEGMVC
jgi:hypothetical protein